MNIIKLCNIWWVGVLNIKIIKIRNIYKLEFYIYLNFHL